jgi:hypothetical protein
MSKYSKEDIINKRDPQCIENLIQSLLKVQHYYLNGSSSYDEYLETIIDINIIDFPFNEWCNKFIEKLEYKLFHANHPELYVRHNFDKKLIDCNNIGELKDELGEEKHLINAFKSRIKLEPNPTNYITSLINYYKSQIIPHDPIRSAAERNENVFIQHRRKGFDVENCRFNIEPSMYLTYLDQEYNLFELIPIDEQPLVYPKILKEVAYGATIASYIEFLEQQYNNYQNTGIQLDNQVQTINDFLGLFEKKENYDSIIKILAQQGYIDEHTCIWIDEKKGNKAILICILKYLKQKGYFKKDLAIKSETYKAIAKNIFRVDVGIDHIKRVKPDEYDMTFIPDAFITP